MWLACGPYFDETGLIGSIVLFALVKPLAYFAFIKAFRYRVSRPIPMRQGQALRLTALRAGLGIGIIGALAALITVLHDETLWTWSWSFLYAERLFSWWLVGHWGAGLRGRRLLGWIISGTLINAAFDAAVVIGLLEGALPQVGVVALVGLFIAALDVIGRRDSLKARFRHMTNCAGCGYDLTGNLSGRCPECGREIDLAPCAAPAA